MDNQEKTDGKACCTTKCCGGKALAVIALLASVPRRLSRGKCGVSKCDVPAAAAPSQPAK